MAKSLLSRPRILELFKSGDIVIDPFDPKNIGTNSYDITLGPHIWRESNPGQLQILDTMLPREYAPTYNGLDVLDWPKDRAEVVYNPYDESHVKKLWVKEEAVPAKTLPVTSPLVGLAPDDLVILVRPGEALLAHTIEFIGGRTARITSMMNARSSSGRNFLEVSRCAGVGDVGYCNRWTMEITNNSRWHTIPLVVGRRIGQLLFYEVDPVDDWTYNDGRKYQIDDLEKMKKTWKPEDMLPKMYLDREVTDADTRE